MCLMSLICKEQHFWLPGDLSMSVQSEQFKHFSLMILFSSIDDVPLVPPSSLVGCQSF